MLNYKKRDSSNHPDIQYDVSSTGVYLVIW